MIPESSRVFRLLALALSITAGCAASPQPPPLNPKPALSVCKLHVIYLDAARIVNGSAIVADRGGLLFTAGHLIAGADILSVEFPDGRPGVGELIFEDSASDIAVLAVEAGPLNEVTLGHDPSVGDQLHILGSAGTSEGRALPDSGIQLSTPFRVADTGAGIFNTRNECVGMLVRGAGTGTTMVGGSKLAALRDLVVREANAGRATPMTPGLIPP